MSQRICATFFYIFSGLVLVSSQRDAPYDFGTNTKGERSDELSPGQIAGISFGAIAVVAGLLVTVLFCYYVRRKQLQDEYSSGSSFLVAPQAKPGSTFLSQRSGY